MWCRAVQAATQSAFCNCCCCCCCRTQRPPICLPEGALHNPKDRYDTSHYYHIIQTNRALIPLNVISYYHEYTHGNKHRKETGGYIIQLFCDKRAMKSLRCARRTLNRRYSQEPCGITERSSFISSSVQCLLMKVPSLFKTEEHRVKDESDLKKYDEVKSVHVAADSFTSVSPQNRFASFLMKIWHYCEDWQ